MTIAGVVGTAGLSAGYQAAAYGLAVVCAALGYVLARRTQQSIGVPPWRIPPVVWALIGALFSVLGLLVETAARLTTRAQVPPHATEAGRGGPPPPPPGATWPPPGTPWGASPPPGPGAAGTYPGPTGPFPAPAGPASAESGRAPGIPAAFPAEGGHGLSGPEGWRPDPFGPAEPPPLFGWYPDPTGRHEHRYWDGRSWSDRVADGGTRADDPFASGDD